MTIKIPLWLKSKFKSDKVTLLHKIIRSLERDNNVPMSHLIRKAIIYFFSMLTGRFNLRRCDHVGARPRTRRRPYIENMGSIHIGNDVNINSRNVQTDLVSGPEGLLEIGNEVSINFGVSIVANKKVSIGDRVRLGPYTMIYDSNLHVHGDRFKRAEGDPVVIEDDVWLATRVMVLKGSRIGKGSMVASGSVVSGIVPPYTVVGGIPARIIKHLDPPKESGFHWEHNYHGPVIRDTTSSRVRKVAADIFLKDIASIKDGHSHASYSNWNSLQHVKFIHALEREFDIRLKKEDWIRMSSIGRITRVIQTYVDKKAEGQHKAQIRI